MTKQPFDLKPAQYSLAEQFGMPIPKEHLIAGYEPGHPAVPPRNDDYVFKRAHLRDFLAFWEESFHALKIEGDPATGKSSLVIEFHARLNWPLYFHSCSSRSEPRDLFGSLLPDPREAGKLRWVDGPALRAAREGTSVLVDEFNLLEPDTGTALNLLAEGNPYDIPETGERVVPRRGFRLFATENPVDSRLLVAGRQVQDVASDDRFMVLRADYMEPDDEIQVVRRALQARNVPDGAATMIATQVVGVANQTRKAWRSGELAIERPMSTRTCIRWARLIRRFMNVRPEEGGPAVYALRRAMRMSETMSQAVEDYTRAAMGTA